MAYADQNTQGTKSVTLITVAALHGAAIWALVAGLSYSRTELYGPIFSARNIPVEKPKTPPPPPDTAHAAHSAPAAPCCSYRLTGRWRR